MPIEPFRVVPTNQREWDQYLRTREIIPDDDSVATDKIIDKAVVETKLGDNSASNRVLRDSLGNSVIGRSAVGVGDPADISIPEGQFLGTRGGVTGGFTLQDSDIPAAIARDTEVSAAIAAHVAAPDPHPQYLLESDASTLYQTQAGLSAAAKSAARVYNVRAVTASTTAGATDDLITADATSGAITVSLLPLSGNTGLRLHVIKTDSTANSVTLDGSGAETINGSATFALTAQYDSVEVVATSSGWFIV